MTVSFQPTQEKAFRTLVRRAADRAVTRIVRLPPALNRYRVTRGVAVPMRDGAELVADLFTPDTSSPRGTILIRAPYGRGYPIAPFFAQPFAARGYHVVVQS